MSSRRNAARAGSRGGDLSRPITPWPRSTSLRCNPTPQRHYHKRLTEMYLILEGEGQLELDGELVPVRPMTAVLIQPGCRHRAVGRLRVAVIPIPAFDPQDEWFD